MKRILSDFRNWEYMLTLAVLVGGVYSIGYLMVQGYLPQPFFYQPFDVWMDWFNTAYWAHNPGAYDSWQTLYPPISFLFLRFLTAPHCYIANEGWYSRDCDWYGMLTMHGWYVLNVYLIGRTFLKIDRSTALPRSFTLAAGMPMLDGLERGNLILVAFTCFLLGYGPLLRSARLRWLMAGLAINFKIYLLGTIFVYPLKRRWRWFEGCLLATLGTYIISWGLLGAGTPQEIITNLSDWNNHLNMASSLLDLWYATSFQPLIGLLNGSGLPISDIIGSWRTETFSLLLPAAIHATQLMIVIAAMVAWLRPETVPTYRLVNLATCIALITTETGGYTQALIVLLTFFEPRKSGLAIGIATFSCYILSIPGDIFIDPVLPQTNNGFLNTGPLFYAYWITVGPFVRPGIVLVVAIALSCATIATVWRDIRTQGWRGRTRFSRDAPIMIAGGRTEPVIG
ncbi:DUF2029 domain-containing protein [Sphingomonas antarctica]|uniref:hypothetical protein n=1 Tax=Sphingomonas antarctica TaxID=2040274 RepID=UPI0039E97EDA